MWHVPECPSFQRRSDIPPYVYTTFGLCTPLPGMWVASTCWLLPIMLLWLWTHVCPYHFKLLLSILLGVHPEMDSLDHMAPLCLIFGWITIPFSAVAIPFYDATNGAQGFQFPHILTDTGNSVLIFVIAAIPLDVNLSFCFSLRAPIRPNSFLLEDLRAVRGKFPFTTRKGHFPRTANSTESLSKHKWSQASEGGGRDEIGALKKCSIIFIIRLHFLCQAKYGTLTPRGLSSILLLA